MQVCYNFSFSASSSVCATLNERGINFCLVKKGVNFVKGGWAGGIEHFLIDSWYCGYGERLAYIQ